MKHFFTPFTTILSLALVLTTSTLHAQVRTKRSAQPQDLSALGISSGNKQATPTLSLSAIDAAPLLLEDEQEALQGKPFRFGLNRAVDVDLIQAAAQTEQNGTRTYSYQITADGAFSINLIFDRFQLKPGSKLYLYNSDRTMLIGPITDAQNPRSGSEFWTDLVQGSTLLIDLQEPIAGSGTSELHLSAVVHAYKNLFPNTNKDFGNAGACHPNMVCYPAFQFEGDGVAMILTSGGGRACTGSIVNDMRQSFRSFFLTADHCTGGNTDSWLIRFNYQSTTCTPGVDDLDVVTLNGTTFRAKWSNSDFALFELTQQVPPDVNTTYNGWNRGAATTKDNFGIHHPRGDVKKISFTNADTQVGSYGSGTSTHVISYWNNLGVTDPGSSGSPLFDGNRRIVGQLHGGPSVCGGNDLRDYYGRVFTSWTGGGTPTTRLSDWLDPDNTTSVSVTNGVKPLVSGPAAFTSASSFSLNTGTSSITAWTVTGGAGIVSPTSGTGNMASLTALSSGTNLTITFGVSAGQSYPIRFAKVFNVSGPPTLSGLAASPTAVCAGSPATFTATVGNFSGTYSFTLSNGSSPISGTASSTAFSQSVTASGSGVQTFTLTVANSFTTTAASTTLTVNAIPVVTITPNPALNIVSGQSATLTASGASAYNWSNSASTTAITVSVAGPYSVTGTTNGCSSTATVTLNTFTIVPPTITAQPASASSVCAGASVVVTVGVSGSISGYQWLKNGSPVAGQNTATLSLGSVQLSDAGVYSLSLTGPAGNTTSSNFTLMVNPVPVVTLTIPVGTTAQGSSGVALITLPANGFPTTFQASGGSSYERQIILDQLNGYAVRQVDQNTSGVFTINRLGLFTLTVMGAGGCNRTVQWVVQRQ
jgi:hypothetical protein